MFKVQEAQPLKYHVDVYRDLSTYPTREDVVFDILSHLLHVIEVKEKTFDKDNLKFTAKTLKYVFGEEFAEASFKTDVAKLLKECIETNIVRKDGDNFFITPEQFDAYFKKVDK